MVAASSLPNALAAEANDEQRLVVRGVPWRTYVLLRDAIDTPRLKMTFCEGVLEITSPSIPHERRKKHIARYLELYAFLTNVYLSATGSATFRHESKERGAEPDESYSVDRDITEGLFPDIVIEVIERSPVLDKLAVYDGFGVAEVWLFEAGKLSIHHRRPKGGYAKARRSAFFPLLDPRILERFSARSDRDALRDFAALVTNAKKKRKKR